MPHRIRNYWRLTEAATKWGVSEHDVIDSALLEMLDLNILVSQLPLVYGQLLKTAEGLTTPSKTEILVFTGLLKLHSEDVFKLRHMGDVFIERFKPCPPYDYAWIVSGKGLLIKPSDIVIEKNEFTRFSDQYGFVANDDVSALGGFEEQDNFRVVKDRKSVV